MKTLRLLLVFCLAAVAFAQTPTAPVETRSQITFPVYTLNAVPVPGANLQIVGVPGQQTYFYWAVANFQEGSIVSPLGSVTNAANTLSCSNYVAISPWSYPSSVLTVDILRTTSGLAPTGACGCAVTGGTGLTSGGVNDQSNSLSGYTVPSFNPTSLGLVLRNEVVGTGSAHLLLRNALTLALVADLSVASSGTVTGSGTLNQIPLWSSSTALGNSIINQFSSSGLNIQIVPTGSFGLDVLPTLPNSCGIGGAATIPTALDPGAANGCTAAYLKVVPNASPSTGVTAGLQVWNAANPSTVSEMLGISAKTQCQSATGSCIAVEADTISNTTSVTKNIALLGYSFLQSNTATTQQGLYILTGTNAGTITNNYGVFVDSPNITGVGTLTHNYGLYIADQTLAGSGTNSDPWGIFEAGTAKNQLGGILNDIAGFQQNGTPLGINCGATSACANTAAPLVHLVYGSAPLVSGTPSVVTVTGISPAFTSTSSYQCSADNSTTAANAVKIVNTSASSITITGPNTVSDVIAYVCAGT